MSSNTNVGVPQGDSTTSKVDLLTGKHTKDIIVGILIVVLLLIVAFGSLKDSVIDRLLDAVLALVGFFAGSKLKE